MSACLDFDPAMRSRTLIHTVDNEIILQTLQDVEPILEANKAAFNQIDERAKYGEMDRVASIPLPIYFELDQKGITRDRKAFKAWLNDPDNRLWRTRPGVV